MSADSGSHTLCDTRAMDAGRNKCPREMYGCGVWDRHISRHLQLNVLSAGCISCLVEGYMCQPGSVGKEENELAPSRRMGEGFYAA